MTILELVVVIFILSIALTSLFKMWANVAWRSSKAEGLIDATFYAQELMEEIRSKKYDENSASPWSTTLGADSGETYATYDDVDDYNGYSDTPATGYTRSATVTYVTLSGSTWGSCGAGSCIARTTCANCNECCYKRIKVTVSRPRIATDVSLTSIVGGGH